MKLLDKISIRRKLSLVFLLISTSVLLLSTLGFVTTDWYTLRSAIYERLEAQADIVGNSTTSALVFGDKLSAQNTLDIFGKSEEIQAAGLFDSQGELFASYERSQGFLLEKLPDEIYGDLGDAVFVKTSIKFNDDTIGNLVLIADLSEWRENQLFNLATAAAVFILSLLVAFILSSRLQGVITKPILDLAKTARRISRLNDYTLRADKVSQDEIGSLVDDFNYMLDQIQSRDRELFLINERLEEKVEKRTQELTELTRQLEHQAYHDHLTGLANRVTFDTSLRHSLERKRRYGGQIAVLFLDLDRFKTINDTLGHAVGDKLLIEVAARLGKCVRKSDTLARLGGDEFAVLIPELKHANTALKVAEHLAEAINEPFQVEDYDLHLSTSIGVSIYPNDGENAEDLMKNADAAMYQSKEHGRNTITHFSKELNDSAERRLALENSLRQAIKSQSFVIYYQPRFDTHTLQIIGVEALIRWFDTTYGEISPEHFIPIAEESGFIGAIDDWVLENACLEILQIDSNLRLAVNVSPANFIRKDFNQSIAHILEATKFPVDRLEIEITESVIGPGNPDVLEKLTDIKVKVAIDDFGTAYSSLSRLKQLPVHTLKIDKSFIQDLGEDTDDEIITQTIISMAHSMNLHVVAEGIENELQYQFIKQNNCDSLQGFMFARPMPVEELKQFLAEYSPPDHVNTSL